MKFQEIFNQSQYPQQSPQKPTKKFPTKTRQSFTTSKKHNNFSFKFHCTPIAMDLSCTHNLNDIYSKSKKKIRKKISLFETLRSLTADNIFTILTFNVWLPFEHTWRKIQKNFLGSFSVPNPQKSHFFANQLSVVKLTFACNHDCFIFISCVVKSCTKEHECLHFSLHENLCKHCNVGNSPTRWTTSK